MYFSEKIFPRIPDLPQEVIEAAALVAMGERPAGWKVIGSGVFNLAISNGEYVIKGGKRGTSLDQKGGIEEFAQEWLELYGNDRAMRRAVKRVLAPTEVLFDGVVVQELLPVLGVDIVESMETITYGDYAADDVYEGARAIGITDAHTANWGLDAEGTIRIHDPMVVEMWGDESSPEQGLRQIQKVARMARM
jgi:hypothetical protein